MQGNDVIAQNQEDLANLFQLQQIMTLFTKNLLLLSSPQNFQTLTTFNADLYRIAAESYGNAALWTVIAQANNLTVPFVNGQVTLIIPATPAPSANTDGVLDLQ
jgi:hypothetical protein